MVGRLLFRIRPIADAVRRDGDTALRHYTRVFDRAVVGDFAVAATDITRSVEHIDPALGAAIDTARDHIDRFHRGQLAIEPAVEIVEGVQCWRRRVPIERVGLYVPGGVTPLFSTALMLGVPAHIAGRPEVVVCTPPREAGTILVEPTDEHTDSWDKFVFVPGVISALRRIATELDYELVMVTNQDGLGTASLPEDTFWPVHNAMLRVLGEGIRFADVLADRTLPDTDAPTRKPGGRAHGRRHPQHEGLAVNVAVIRHNAGNTLSVQNALARLGITATATDDAEMIALADRVILPGVGEASTAMEHLRARGLDEVIVGLRQPFLGICLGMQLLCTHSEENDTAGLGVFNARVRRLPARGKVPHMGWNSVSFTDDPLFAGLDDAAFAYFVHSYYADTGTDTIARVRHVVTFSAALRRRNGDIGAVLGAGATRVVTGSAAVNDRARVLEWLARFGAERMVIAADSLHGRVRVDAWRRECDLEVIDMLRDYRGSGARWALCTDVSRDGEMDGSALELWRARSTSRSPWVAACARARTPARALPLSGADKVAVRI